MRRDKFRCKITGQIGAPKGSHLIAFQVNTTAHRVKLLNEASRIPLILFKKEFADFI